MASTKKSRKNVETVETETVEQTAPETTEVVAETETVVEAAVEQLAEAAEAVADGTDVTETAPESSGDAAVAQQPIVIDPTQPWAMWGRPESLNLNISNLEVRVDDHNELILKSKESGDDLGKTTKTALRQLGWQTQFPVDFIEKLDPGTRAVVINERIAKTAEKDREVAVILEDGDFTNLMPGWRETLPYQDIAQVTYDTLRNVYDEVTIDTARTHDGQMSLRMVTNVAEEVTRHKGDVLQMGVDIFHDYGREINLSLFVKRLVCLNGMTADTREFSWRSRQTGTKDHQVAWLREGISQVIGAYEQLVARAKRMAEARIETDNIEAVLREHARAMRLPGRYFSALQESYNRELEALGGEHTEWTILNAFTRLATHGGINPGNARDIQRASGEWTRNFEMVTARLPRPMASLVGAQLVEA